MSEREIAWTPEGEAALLRALDAANGRRGGRRLTPAQVRACAAEALASPEGHAWCNGGEVDDARAVTTVCLAVATPAGVTIGVAAARAQGVTPARAWADLRAWDRFHAPANVAECRAWASRAREDRVRFGRHSVHPRVELEGERLVSRWCDSEGTAKQSPGLRPALKGGEIASVVARKRHSLATTWMKQKVMMTLRRKHGVRNMYFIISRTVTSNQILW